MLSCAAIAALIAMPGAAKPTTTTGPARLLLRPADLPAGFVGDNALENADATHRALTYRAVTRWSVFAGFRTRDAAAMQFVALLRSRAAARLYLAAEAAAVDRTHGAERITVPGRYGDADTVAYQERSTRGEWVVALFARGPLVTAVGSYRRDDEQGAIDLLAHLAATADRRIAAAAPSLPELATSATAHGRPPQITALETTTSRGHTADGFHPSSLISWQVRWSVARVAPRARETLQARVTMGAHTLYTRTLVDRAYPGANVLSDHLQLRRATPGTYALTIGVHLGADTVRATHRFRVSATH